MLRRVLLLLCLLPASPLRAEDSTRDYGSLVREAVVAQQDGDYARAIQLFQAAHQLSPTARTLRGLGVAEFLAGDAVAAIGHLEASLIHPEKPLNAELRSAVEDLLTRARARVASYRLETSPEGVIARVDDGEPRPAKGLALVLAPGAHELVLSLEGHLSETLALNAQAGTREVLRVQLSPVLANAGALPPAVLAPGPEEATPGVLVPPARPADAERSGRGTTRRARAKWGTLAAGGASAISAVAVLLTAARRTAMIESQCERDGCSDERSEKEEKRAHLSQLKTAFFATSALAAAALSSSLGLWVVELRGRERADSPPVQGATLSLRKSF